MNGFNAIFNKQSKILILGSFPSVISREANFYYGNNKNRFWKLMEEKFNKKLITTQDKTNFLLEHNIALWDIVETCEITGSMDIAIKNPKFVNLQMVLPPKTNVSIILCNGKKSFELTNKYVIENNIKTPILYLPSTSPANVKFDKTLWFNALDKIQTRTLKIDK